MSLSPQTLHRLHHLPRASSPEPDRTDAFLEALSFAVSELCEQEGAQAIDPLEVSDLFLKQLKTKLKGWKVFDWDFLSRKVGTLEIDLRVKSPDGKVKRRPHASVQASDGKFSATYTLDRKGKKGAVKGSSLKDIINKIAAGLGNALSGLKEDTMPDSLESVFAELLNFCTEKGIELESEDLSDLVEELGEWMVCPDLNEGDVSALGQFVERLKKMIVTMLKKKKSDKEGEPPGDAGDDGEDDEQVNEGVSIRSLATDLRGLTEQAKAKKGKAPKLGTGKRFAALAAKLKKTRPEVKDPKALAAWIGRKKYGKAKFQKMAAKGKK
jgi:hypothetical protein